MKKMPDHVVDAMTAYWGERCPEYAEDCPCCEAWAAFDAHVGAVAAEAHAAEVERLKIEVNQAAATTVYVIEGHPRWGDDHGFNAASAGAPEGEA